MPAAPKPILPGLVIGLGSTGLRILEYFQQFVYEEFGRYDLPALRFLCFETWRNQPSHPTIEMHAITVPSMDRIRYQLRSEPESPKTRALEAWMPDAQTLGESFEEGARGLRPGGRLILWHNWERVHQAVLNAWQGVRSDENRRKSEDRIREEYERRNLPPGETAKLLHDDPAVYVVGTLCGGTCSGMFIDFGHLCGMVCDGLKPQGIFSVISEDEARQAMYRMPALNCYGALREADFYYHDAPAGAWGYALGDGHSKVESGRSWPYRRIYLVSCKSQNGLRIAEESLNQMVAMNLFLDMIGGMQHHKGAALTDLREDINRPVNPQGRVRTFLSFGLSSVWHPKYKVSGAVACRLIRQLLERWLGAGEDAIPARKAAQEDYESLMPFCDRAMRGPGGNDLFLAVSRTVEEKARGTGAVANFGFNLREFDDPSLFEAEMGQIDDRITTLKGEIRQRMEANFTERFNSGEFTLEQMKAYLEDFRAKAQRGLETAVDEAPPEYDGKPLQPYLRAIRGTARDPWLSAVSLFGLTPLKKRAVAESRRRYLAAVARLWKKLLQQKINQYRPVVLETIERKAGELLDVAGELEETLRSIRRLSGEAAQSRFGEANTSQIIDLVYSHPAFEDDVAECEAGLKRDNPALLDRLRAIQSRESPTAPGEPLAFFRRKPETVFRGLMDHYQKQALLHLGAFNILQRIFNRSNRRLAELAKAALPYIRLNARYNEAETRFHRSKDFVFANDPRDETAMPAIKKAAEEAELNTQETNCVSMGLEQMLFFYREQNPFAIDEMEIFDGLQERANANRGDRGAFHFCFTHREGERFFNASRFSDLEEVRASMRVARKLFPDSVFAAAGEGEYVFHLSRGFDVMAIRANDEEAWRTIADTEGGKAQLDNKISIALRQMGGERYRDEIRAWQEDLSNRKIQAERTDPAGADRMEDVLRSIQTFNRTSARRVFGEAAPPGPPAV